MLVGGGVVVGGAVVVDGCAIVGLVGVPVVGVDGFGCAIVGLVAGAVMVGVVVVAPGVVVVAPGVVPTPLVVVPVVPTPMVGVVAPAGTPPEPDGAQVEVPGVPWLGNGVVPAALPSGMVPLTLLVPVVLPTLVVPVDPAQIAVCVWVAVVVEVGAGSVPDAGDAALGFVFVVVGMAGVVPVCDPVAVPGAVVVGVAGVVPPAAGAWAKTIPAVRHTAAVTASRRVAISITPIFEWDGAAPPVDAMNRKLRRTRSVGRNDARI